MKIVSSESRLQTVLNGLPLPKRAPHYAVMSLQLLSLLHRLGVDPDLDLLRDDMLDMGFLSGLTLFISSLKTGYNKHSIHRPLQIMFTKYTFSIMYSISKEVEWILSISSKVDDTTEYENDHRKIQIKQLFEMWSAIGCNFLDIMIPAYTKEMSTLGYKLWAYIEDTSLTHSLFSSLVAKIIDKTAHINKHNKDSKGNSDTNTDINGNLVLLNSPGVLNSHNFANLASDSLVHHCSPFLLFLQELLLAHVTTVATKSFLNELGYLEPLVQRCQKIITHRGSSSDYCFMYLLLQLISTISMASPQAANYFNLKYRTFIEENSINKKKPKY